MYFKLIHHLSFVVLYILSFSWIVTHNFWWETELFMASTVHMYWQRAIGQRVVGEDYTMRCNTKGKQKAKSTSKYVFGSSKKSKKSLFASFTEKQCKTGNVSLLRQLPLFKQLVKCLSLWGVPLLGSEGTYLVAL